MNPLTRAELEALLAAEGIDPQCLEDLPDEQGQESPWFVRVLVGFGAWVAGILIAGGLVVMLSLQHAGAALLGMGLLFCAGACAGRRVFRGDFPEQLALSISVAGQVMVAGGLLDRFVLFGRDETLFGGMLLLEAALVVLFQDARHRLLSTGAAGIFLCLLLAKLGVGWLASPLLGGLLLAWWVIPAASWGPRTIPFRRPVFHGLAATFALILLHSPSGSFMFWLLDRVDPAGSFWTLPRVLAALAPGVLLGIAALGILRRLGVGRATSAGILLAWAGLTVLGLWAPGVPAMLFVVALAMEAREKAAVVVASAAGALFLGRFYYDLETILLVKSGILLASGALLLALRFWMKRKGAPC